VRYKIPDNMDMSGIELMFYDLDCCASQWPSFQVLLRVDLGVVNGIIQLQYLITRFGQGLVFTTEMIDSGFDL